MRNTIAGILLIALVACSEPPPSTRPTMGPITEAVYASGVVKAVDQYQVYAAVSGIVSRVHVQAGDSVEVGDALFTIEDRASGLGSERAVLALERLRQDAAETSPTMEQLRLAVEQARARMVNDSLMVLRQRNLWQRQVGSRSELDARELAYTTSQSAWRTAVKAQAEMRQRLRNEVRLAENELALRRAAEGDHTVRALVAGRVYSVLIERGELAVPQRALAVLGRAGNFLLELQVDEYDIVRVGAGQKAWVTMDSYKDQVMEAQVTRVDPMMNERTRTFTVEAVFLVPPPRLYPNLTAEANIVVAHKEHALTIPASHLVDGAFVITGKDQRTPVEVGLKDLQRVEVLSGVDSTTVIYHP